MNLERTVEAIPGCRPSGYGGYRLACLSCGRKRSMVFLPQREHFRCYGCGIGGDLQQFARVLQRAGYAVTLDHQSAPTLERLESVIDRLKDPPEDPSEGCVVVPMPKESIPVTDKLWPVYLTTRRVPRNIPLDFGWRFCVGGKFSGHVLIPVHTLGNEAWVAYQTNRDTSLQLSKTLDPFGYPKGKMLYLYEGAELQAPRSIILVEGIMDAVRALVYHAEMVGGPYPLGLLGSIVTDDQGRALDFLARHNGLQQVFLALDADAWDEGKIHPALRTLERHLGGLTIKVVDLRPYGQADPDQMGVDQWVEAIRNARLARYLV